MLPEASRVTSHIVNNCGFCRPRASFALLGAYGIRRYFYIFGAGASSLAEMLVRAYNESLNRRFRPQLFCVTPAALTNALR